MEFGQVFDAKDNKIYYFSHRTTLGFGLSLGINNHEIHTTRKEPFNVNLYSGPAAGYDFGLGIFSGSFGGNLTLDNTPQDGFLPRDFGFNYLEGGFGMGVGARAGAWRSKTNTIFF